MSEQRERPVVVIDDDGAMRRVFERLLVRNGFEALLAADRESGLALIHQHQPIVVLLDYELGATTGAQIAAEITASLGDHAPPLILVSAIADRIPLDEQALFDAVHVKPFRPSLLVDDIARLAGRGEEKRSGVRAIDARIAARRAKMG